MDELENPTGPTEAAVSSPCVVCRLPLPIRPTPTSEAGRNWFCTRCKTKHHGMLIEEAPEEIRKNVRAEKSTSSPKPSAATSVAAQAPLGKSTKPLPARESVECHHENRESRRLDDAIKSGVDLAVEAVGPPLIHSVKDHGATRYDEETEAQFVEGFQQSQDQLESLVVALETGKSFELGATESITRESLAHATEDMDLFVRLGINPTCNEFAAKHSFHVAMLASSLGATLGWDGETIVELGIGCLLHDLGMMRVPDECYKSEKVIELSEFVEIVRHPLHTFDILAEHCDSVSTVSRMVAYQLHERLNGTGYPRKRDAGGIHEAAKVAAVADVYVALVSPRPHRPALMPYYALEHLLHGVRKGEFDSSAVRALLGTVSLFPIGSYLALKDGRVGRTIRANPREYARPVIEVWHPDGLDQTPEVIDLAQEADIAIQGPLASLEKE